MNSVRVTVVLLLFLARSASAGETNLPNVVLILIDDMGWRDVGFAGNTFVETPNIDRIAREGIQFTQAYASAPNCAPTRVFDVGAVYASPRRFHRDRSAT